MLERIEGPKSTVSYFVEREAFEKLLKLISNLRNQWEVKIGVSFEYLKVFGLAPHKFNDDELIQIDWKYHQRPPLPYPSAAILITSAGERCLLSCTNGVL